LLKVPSVAAARANVTIPNRRIMPNKITIGILLRSPKAIENCSRKIQNFRKINFISINNAFYTKIYYSKIE
jgi:hypothetical protein